MLEPYITLPELAISDTAFQQRHSAFIANTDVSEVYHTRHMFCAIVNDLGKKDEKLPESTFLDTMASTMYRMEHIGPQASPVEEAIRLATLAFTAKTFLQWRDPHLPLPWLLSQYKHSITLLMQSHTSSSDHLPVVVWLLATFGLSLPPASVEPSLEYGILLDWLTDATRLCALDCWEDARRCLRQFLWIDLLCDQAAGRIFKDVFARREIREQVDRALVV